MWKCPGCGRVFKNTDQSHYCKEILSVDAYIAEQEESVRPLLEKVRACIRAAAPEAEERISWRMPTYWRGENLIHFAAFRKHIGLYPGTEATAAFADRLAGYKIAKGTVQLPLDKPVPFDLIAEIVRWRVSAVTDKRRPEQPSE